MEFTWWIWLIIGMVIGWLSGVLSVVGYVYFKIKRFTDRIKEKID